ncbi:MAG: DUF4345 domain-containing protein [Hyphomicrobium sp.]
MLNPQFERRLLQIAVAVAGLVPVFGGLSGVVLGAEMFDGAIAAGTVEAISADSHIRYLSGLLLGIGLVFWSFIPRIERVGFFVRRLTFLVVGGGVARLASLIVAGVPSRTMLAALAMEMIVTPALCLWQARVSKRCGVND